MKRAEQLKKLKELKRRARGRFDVLVVGGGINGAVTALCLARKGVSVALVEAGDFAGQTSQASSNLIWGGIKYLENFELGLVRKLSKSRNRLLKHYPGLVQELRFLSPHKKTDKHSLIKLYLGAWFYWLWGGLKTRLPRFHTVPSLRRTKFPLNFKGINGGFEYSDAYLIENDARFVFNFIREAEAAGATVLNYVALKTTKQKRDKTTGTPYWESQLYDKVGKRSYTVASRVFINAAGPHIDTIHRKNNVTTEHQHVFSKGVHLIVKQLLPDRRALAFYANDGRLFFALPMGECTCIGTTDTRVDKADVRVLPEDRTFILENINALLNLERPLTTRDIISERCGVRPLVQAVGRTAQDSAGVDWFSLSRKHVIEQNHLARHISIFGGKLTDCLNVGVEVYAVVQKWLVPHQTTESPESPDASEKPEKQDEKADEVWFGEPKAEDREAFITRAIRILPEKTARRLWRRYQLHALVMIERLEALHHQMLQVTSELGERGSEEPTAQPKLKPPKSGRMAKKWEREWNRLTSPLIAGYHTMVIELEYAMEHELIVKLEDFLRRRTMLELVVPSKVLRANQTLMKIKKKLT